MRRYSAIALIVCGSLALAGACGDADTTQSPPAPIAPHIVPPTSAPLKDPQSPPPPSEWDSEWDKDFHPRPRDSRSRE